MDKRLKEFIDTNTYRHNETGDYVKHGGNHEINGQPAGIALHLFDNPNELRFVSKEEFERDYTKVDVDNELQVNNSIM